MKAAILVAKAFVLAFGIFHLFVALRAVPFSDGEAYWQAGERIRHGLPLFPAVADPDAASVYRYAPWFAWAWAPLTLLPKLLVAVAWTAVLGAASIVASWRVASLGWYGIGLLAITAPLLLQSTIIGNVQPLLVAGLLLGLESRLGPLVVAVAVSLKATPIFLVAVYAGRHEWWRVAVCLLLTVALVAPLLLVDISQYPGTAGMEPVPLPLLALAGLALTVAAAVLARTPYGWLTGSLAVALSQPRPNPYNLTFILVGLTQLVRRKHDAQQ